MRIDVVSIFPDYLAPLTLSLPGKAQERGLIQLAAHDLRQWTTDRHRTVDDTPYGGGAGMVMKPEPWGAALDDLAGAGTVLVVPTPAGVRFTQEVAAELAEEPHLIFACGRYEGIDQRVLDHAASRMRVVELSLGDYVLNGGEVAAMAMIEAVVRLIPGFMGNAESLVEESHQDGLLEYPSYTKPAHWRDLEVPAVLLSGDHGAIAAWRHQRKVERTARRRPDLLPAIEAGGGVLAVATAAESGEIYTVARAAGVTDVELSAVRGAAAAGEVLILRRSGRLVAALRARIGSVAEQASWELSDLVVAPDLWGTGVGRALVEAALARRPAGFLVRLRGVPAELAKPVRRAGFRPAPGGANDWISRR